MNWDAANSPAKKNSTRQNKEMRFFVASPPTQTISVNSLNKNERDGLKESVVIMQLNMQTDRCGSLNDPTQLTDAKIRRASPSDVRG